jgi:hypothetical protein
VAAGSLLAGVVEEALANVFPDGVRTIQTDGI